MRSLLSVSGVIVLKNAFFSAGVCKCIDVIALNAKEIISHVNDHFKEYIDLMQLYLESVWHNPNCFLQEPGVEPSTSNDGRSNFLFLLPETEGVFLDAEA